MIFFRYSTRTIRGFPRNFFSYSFCCSENPPLICSLDIPPCITTRYLCFPKIPSVIYSEVTPELFPRNLYMHFIKDQFFLAIFSGVYRFVSPYISSNSNSNTFMNSSTASFGNSSRNFLKEFSRNAYKIYQLIPFQIAPAAPGVLKAFLEESPGFYFFKSLFDLLLWIFFSDIPSGVFYMGSTRYVFRKFSILLSYFQKSLRISFRIPFRNSSRNIS